MHVLGKPGAVGERCRIEQRSLSEVGNALCRGKGPASPWSPCKTLRRAQTPCQTAKWTRRLPSRFRSAAQHQVFAAVSELFWPERSAAARSSSPHLSTTSLCSRRIASARYRPRTRRTFQYSGCLLARSGVQPVQDWYVEAGFATRRTRSKTKKTLFRHIGNLVNSLGDRGRPMSSRHAYCEACLRRKGYCRAKAGPGVHLLGNQTWLVLCFQRA